MRRNITATIALSTKQFLFFFYSKLILIRNNLHANNSNHDNYCTSHPNHLLLKCHPYHSLIIYHLLCINKFSRKSNVDFQVKKLYNFFHFLNIIFGWIIGLVSLDANIRTNPNWNGHLRVIFYLRILWLCVSMWLLMLRNIRWMALHGNVLCPIARRWYHSFLTIEQFRRKIRRKYWKFSISVLTFYIFIRLSL